MAATRKKLRLPRRFTSHMFQPYVIAIGQLSLSWNSLHEALATLFMIALWDESMERAHGIWNSSNFDRPKREMLKGVIKAATEDEITRWPRLVEDVLWLLHQVDVLEDARNDAIHSPFLSFFLEDGTDKKHVQAVIPSLIHQNPRAIKLAKKDLLTEFRWCRDSCITLRDYAYRMSGAMSEHYAPGVVHAPWPNRPSLPNRGQKKTRPIRQRQAHPK